LFNVLLQVVINSSLFPECKYSHSNNVFHTWTDAQFAYGIHFASEDLAKKFSSDFAGCVAALNKPVEAAAVASSDSAAPPPPPPGEPPAPPSAGPAGLSLVKKETLSALLSNVLSLFSPFIKGGANCGQEAEES
jgi:hypothetical protein